MQFENPMTFVRSLKGAPASVLWALMFTRQMMTSLELQQWTGYKDDNITLATRLLVSLGWVVARSPRGPWGLAEGRQLPLMPGIERLANVESVESDLIGINALNVLSSSSSENHSTIELKEQEETDDSDLIGIIKANLEACDECGIREPKRSLIAKLRHVKPDFIHGHVRQIKAEALPLGTAIHRIQYNWSVDPQYQTVKDNDLDMNKYWSDYLRRQKESSEEE